MRHKTCVLLLLVAACTAAETPPADRASAGPGGKADGLAGSCLVPDGACGAVSEGGCWCDELCVEYGDCCADAAETCGVDECTPDAGCSDGGACISDGVAFDCVDACSAPCPAGWRLAPNFTGLAFCLAEGTECALDGVTMPAGAKPYCHYVEDGYFGFYWEACAPGTTFELGEGDEQRCAVRPEALPVGAEAYCHYVEDGYFGFSWALADDPDYACPTTMRYAPNGAGTGYCLIEFDDMPGGILPWCDAGATVLGYQWNAGVCD